MRAVSSENHQEKEIPFKLLLTPGTGVRGDWMAS